MYITTIESTLLARADDFKKRRFLESIVIEHAYIENYLQRKLEMSLADPKRDLPAKTHYYKIELACKVGLISPRFCKDLHSVRLIRNSFVHRELEEDDEKGYAKLTFDIKKVSKHSSALITSFIEFLRKFAIRIAIIIDIQSTIKHIQPRIDTYPDRPDVPFPHCQYWLDREGELHIMRA